MNRYTRNSRGLKDDLVELWVKTPPKNFTNQTIQITVCIEQNVFSHTISQILKMRKSIQQKSNLIQFATIKLIHQKPD